MQSPEERSCLHTPSSVRLRSPDVVAMISETLVNVSRTWNPALKPTIRATESASSVRQLMPLVSKVKIGLYPMAKNVLLSHATTMQGHVWRHPIRQSGETMGC